MDGEGQRPTAQAPFLFPASLFSIYLPLLFFRVLPRVPRAIVFLSFFSAALAAEPKMLIGWEFKTEADLKAWQWNNHVADVKVEDGALSCRVVGSDPIFISPTFDIPARQSQWIETRIRANVSGDAEFFWTNTLETKYGGFSPGKETHFRILGDGQWHAYRILPCWEPERKIIKLRLDLPGGKGAYEVACIRVADARESAAVAEPSWDFSNGIQGWELENASPPQFHGKDMSFFARGSPARLLSPPLSFPAQGRFLVSLRLYISGGKTATLGFANDVDSGLHTQSFAIHADGTRPHDYLVDLSAHPRWRGTIRRLTLEPTDASDDGLGIYWIRLGSKPEGEPEVTLRFPGIAEGMPRVGQRLTVTAVAVNEGAGVARRIRATLAMPAHLEPLCPLTQELSDLWPGETRLLEWPVKAVRQGEDHATLHLNLSVNGSPEQFWRARFTVSPSLDLPKADYVPEPKPAKTDCQVGAYYFPGWHSWARWRPIADFPERKPLLGWYDESKPEVADWQIKWAVEHGVSFFAVDWYWCQGARHLEHWLHDAYLKSRYRRYLKFCLLWANHNPPKTSSEADLLAATGFWLEHYFKLPEYLTVEGKPVVIIFSTHRLTDDLGTPAVAAAFAKMRERCRAAGLPGLYLVACAGADRGSLERLKAEGYDAASGYNYPSLGSNGRRWFPYADNIAAYKRLWHAAADHRLLKEIPVLSGGWDSRPWHGQGALVVADRSPALFERHCRDAREFLDKRDGDTGPPLKMCLVEAWNEWGEGSYIGPHREFGFGYLDAIRRVFAPGSPEPSPVTPRDLGLGPYELPRPKEEFKVAWDFSRPEDRTDWQADAQMRPDAAAATLKGTATGNDPILGGPVVRIPAEAHPWLCVEMRTSKPERPQLFWSTTTARVSENNSVRFDVPGDGQLHAHWVELGRVPYWTGLITGLRFDPVNAPGVEFEIRSLRFAAQRPAD